MIEVAIEFFALEARILFKPEVATDGPGKEQEIGQLRALQSIVKPGKSQKWAT